MSLTSRRADTGPSTGSAQPSAASERSTWTFLTNHGHVLLAVATSPDQRVSDIAAAVGITTRATLTILGDLEDAGYLSRTRVGRRTHYTLDPRRHFRHHLAGGHEIGELLAIFTTPAP